jgi:hypothetical protein
MFDMNSFIGQRWSDPGVETDCSHYGFTVKPGGDDKPMIEVCNTMT